MTTDLINIHKKLNQSINDLCLYMTSVKPEDRRYCYIPLINNLEEALKELKVLEASVSFRAFKSLEECKKHPEGFYMNKKEESND